MAFLRPEGPLCGEFLEARVLEPPTNEDSLLVRDARSELPGGQVVFHRADANELHNYQYWLRAGDDRTVRTLESFYSDCHGASPTTARMAI